MSNQYNIPLWMGESGENSNSWYYEVFVELLEENNIGWNFWTHKKVEKISSPFSAIVTPQYQTLINYWSGSGAEPSQTYAQAALLTFTNSLKIENCIFQPGVIASLTDPEYGEISKPYSTHFIPGVIPAVEYDIGAWGVSYTDSDYYNNGDGNYNDGWTFRNDGVDVESNGDQNGMPYNVGWTEAGEWLGYTIEDVTPGTYDINISIASTSSNGMFFVQLNGENLSVIQVPNTGGWYTWQNVTIPSVDVSDGSKFFKIQIVQAGFNIESIEFESLMETEGQKTIPNGFVLGTPFPNPFNPSVSIELIIEISGNYDLSIYNLKGGRIKNWDSVQLDARKHMLRWNGMDEFGNSSPSGVYFFRVEGNNKSKHRKLLLMR